MWELDYKESWVTKNWCFGTVVLEKTLESPLDSKEIQRVHPKGNQFWIFVGRTDAEAETPILWPPDAKNWLLGKDPDAGKDWRQEEKGTTEDEMVEWHHQLDGHECEWALRVGDGQGGLACCSPWGQKESDTTGRLLELTWSGALFSVSCGASILFSVAAAAVHTHSSSAPRCLFSPPGQRFTSGLSDGSRSHGYEMASHCSLSFPWLVMLSTFSCTCWPFEYLLWKTVYQALCPFLILLLLLLSKFLFSLIRSHL